jgi:hypothetical protein
MAVRTHNGSSFGKKRKCSNAKSRWSWSGAEGLSTPPLSDEALTRLYKLLVSPRSTVEELTTKIQELGARYHRYLHQDEFGPTRAERMSTLRAVWAQIMELDSLILDLPQHLVLDLLGNSTNQSNFQSWTIGQIHQAANIQLSSRHSQYSTNDLNVLENICATAEGAALQADGETRSACAASSIRRRSAA